MSKIKPHEFVPPAPGTRDAEYGWCAREDCGSTADSYAHASEEERRKFDARRDGSTDPLDEGKTIIGTLQERGYAPAWRTGRTFADVFDLAGSAGRVRVTAWHVDDGFEFAVAGLDGKDRSDWHIKFAASVPASVIIAVIDAAEAVAGAGAALPDDYDGTRSRDGVTSDGQHLAR